MLLATLTCNIVLCAHTHTHTYKKCRWSRQSCLTLCDPVDCSPPSFSTHGIFQARVLEWVAIPFSRGSSPPRDQTQIFWTAGRCVIVWATQAHVQREWLQSFLFYFFWSIVALQCCAFLLYSKLNQLQVCVCVCVCILSFSDSFPFKSPHRTKQSPCTIYWYPRLSLVTYFI